MRKLFLVLVGFCMMSSVSAQTVDKGDNIINIGFGVDPYYSIATGYGSVSRSSIGPIVLGYEKIVTDKLGIGRIGVGGMIGQSFYTYKYQYYYSNYYNYSYQDRVSRTALLGKCAYHFDLPVKGLDLYAGVGAGLYFHNRTITETDYYNVTRETKRSSVVGAHYVFGGVRYFFSDAFGVYAELGHGMNLLNLGLAFKF